MCFSASASFTSTVVLAAVGLATVLQAKDKKILAWAMTPCFFAFQQFMEGIIWLTHDAPDWELTLKFATYVFLIFALFLWPMWLPWSVYITERNTHRKKMIFGCIISGCVVALMGVIDSFVTQLYGFKIQKNICYAITSIICSESSIGVTWNYFMVGFYAIATTLPFFFSSLRYAWIVGVVSVLSIVVAQGFYPYGFASVWCFFAALSSLTIYFVVRAYRKTS